MQIKYRVIVLLLLLFCASSLFAQVVVPDIIMPDTIVSKRQQEKSTQFYDNLKTKTSGSRLSKTLYNSIMRGSGENPIQYSPEKTLAKEIVYFNQFKDRKIDNIYIYRNNVFDITNSKDIIQRVGNDLHVVTAERVIRQNLLFKKGEVLSPEVMSINEQLLRGLAFISEAYIVVSPNSGEGGGVNVYVFTRDTWSITARVESAQKNQYFLGVYENNFLGTGDRLGLRTYASTKKPLYGGNMVEYRMLNVRGSFFDVDAFAGRGFDEYRYSVSVARKLIKPTDYALGGSLNRSRFFEIQPLTDTIKLVASVNSQLWGGRSWKKNSLDGNLFLTSSYRNINFSERSNVSADSNTFYHNRQVFLVGAGIYRESFYRGNMIYAFGVTEDIPYGYKVQLTSGREWAEFEDKWYGALSYTTAKQTSLGYFRTELIGSSFFNSHGHIQQGAFNANVNYFSNMFSWGLTGIRQFVNVSYLRGFARGKGEGESLSFFGFQAPRKMGFLGNNRLVINAETVVFTPLYLYGFRFAFYGFWDAGWLGDKTPVFSNDYFTTFGIGARFRNERLIFNTIQIRLGFAMGRNGALNYTNLRYSSPQRLNIPTFRPDAPETVVFR